MKYEIGDLVKDEDGNEGIVCIRWNDGDICMIENDAAHPNPKLTGTCLDVPVWMKSKDNL